MSQSFPLFFRARWEKEAERDGGRSVGPGWPQAMNAYVGTAVHERVHCFGAGPFFSSYKGLGCGSLLFYFDLLRSLIYILVP